jgi:hypothetical protein
MIIWYERRAETKPRMEARQTVIRVIAILVVVLLFFYLFECSQPSVPMWAEVAGEAASRHARLIPGR